MGSQFSDLYGCVGKKKFFSIILMLRLMQQTAFVKLIKKTIRLINVFCLPGRKKEGSSVCFTTRYSAVKAQGRGRFQGKRKSTLLQQGCISVCAAFFYLELQIRNLLYQDRVCRYNFSKMFDFFKPLYHYYQIYI